MWQNNSNPYNNGPNEPYGGSRWPDPYSGSSEGPNSQPNAPYQEQPTTPYSNQAFSNPYSNNSPWPNPTSNGPTNNNPYWQAWPSYYPVPVRRKRGLPWFVSTFLTFLVILGLCGGLLFLSKRDGAVITLPAPGGTSSETEGGGYNFTVQPNDPLFDNQYALKNINATGAWAVTTGKSSVIVAVIDTGVDASHPDLQGRLVKGYDFVNNDDTPEDTVGHGTFVASLIAANADDNQGIVGVAPGVQIMPLKALDRQGGDSLTIARAIRYAADNKANVINLSLGGPQNSRSIRQAIDYATSRGVVVVAASGNSGTKGNPVEYPAALPNVVSVGATGPSDKIASFSSHNITVDVAAPGVNVFGARSSINLICRAYNGTPYCTASGTSFAAPYVAGAAALVLSVNPNLTPAQVENILTSTATDLGQPGTDSYYGAGLINVEKAVNAAKAGVGA